MTYGILREENWPTAAQRLLLRAALLDGDAAKRAWAEWQSGNDLLALDHGSFFVLPSLMRNLRRAGVEEPLPKEVRGTSRFAWCKNQLASGSLTAVIRLLEGAGIRAVLLKGAPLVLFHYRDLGARMMNDIDVLIHEEDVPAAVPLLAESEWRPIEPLPPTDFLPFLHGLAYRHPRWLELDLHWRPFTIDCPPSAEERFWDRVVERQVRGETVRVPDPTDLLLLTCYNARKGDVQAACRWVIDAATLIESADPPVDWDALLSRTRDAGLLAPVRDALTVLAQEFSVAVPEAVLRRAWSVSASREEIRRYERILNGFLTAGPGLRWRLEYHRSSYARVARRRGRRPSLLGFLRHLLDFHHWYYETRRRWHVPFVAMSRFLTRFRGRP